MKWPVIVGVDCIAVASCKRVMLLKEMSRENVNVSCNLFESQGYEGIYYTKRLQAS
jgi:hypothetical protein